jgi:hypothetical protein
MYSGRLRTAVILITTNLISSVARSGQHCRRYDGSYFSDCPERPRSQRTCLLPRRLERVGHVRARAGAADTQRIFTPHAVDVNRLRRPLAPTSRAREDASSRKRAHWFFGLSEAMSFRGRATRRRRLLAAQAVAGARLSRARGRSQCEVEHRPRSPMQTLSKTQ